MKNIESTVTSLDGRVSSTKKCLEEVRKRTEALEQRNHSMEVQGVLCDMFYGPTTGLHLQNG